MLGDQLQFSDLFYSFRTLLQGSFGKAEIYAVPTTNTMFSLYTSFGDLLFLIYVLFVIVVLLNLLIAMMGATYDNIKQSSKKEYYRDLSRRVRIYRIIHWLVLPPFILLQIPQIINRLSDPKTYLYNKPGRDFTFGKSTEFLWKLSETSTHEQHQ
eukprot:TRINITY_DN4853_c0_g2_i1.p1 TRINITY_DN4853_c0_g2~~TRINITY_DN4853_c0_g2_i1.p1  ORF type:complete len:155 (-),score=17.03 TRINITY_DN4853_c0_g2_i1:53-517(-)